MLGETEKQFFLTRAASSTGGARPKLPMSISNSVILRVVRLAACIPLVLALHPRLLAQTFVLDNYNSGNIVVNSSTTYGIDQHVSGVLGGVRIIDFLKQDEPSATSLTIGSGVLTFNATTPGDWFTLSDGYVPGRTVDLTPYNAFALTLLNAPAGSGYLTMGAGDTSTGAAGALASLPESGTGTAVFPFSWWDGSGVDFHNIFEVEVDFYAAVPGTYVFDNLQAVVVPEPATLTLSLIGGLALWLIASPSCRRLDGRAARRCVGQLLRENKWHCPRFNSVAVGLVAFAHRRRPQYVRRIKAVTHQ